MQSWLEAESCRAVWSKQRRMCNLHALRDNPGETRLDDDNGDNNGITGHTARPSPPCQPSRPGCKPQPWLQAASQRRSWTNDWPCRCHANVMQDNVMRAPCKCHARQMPCDYHVSVMQVPCKCHASIFTLVKAVFTSPARPACPECESRS